MLKNRVLCRVSRKVFLVLFLFSTIIAKTQVLTMKDAIQIAGNNYGTIKAKSNYARSSEASAKEAAIDHLPNLNAAAQQAYGTANGQFGPLFANGGLNAASSGPTFPAQNWNAAFGSLYLANVNWDFFTFGRIREKVKVAKAQVTRDTKDLEQEKFQHQVRVAAAYLNLLAAQRLKYSQQKNLDRANALRSVVVARAKSGLNPGVDSSLANAEVSSAKIALTNAASFEYEQAGQLAQLMAIPYKRFELDTLSISRIPKTLSAPAQPKESEHPVLQYYGSRVDMSREQEKYFRRFKYPSLSLIGVVQTRGSGFGNDYSEIHPESYSHEYWNGIQPDRSNYLFGVGITWNLTSILRSRQQVMAQQFTSRGLQDEYDLVRQQLDVQLALAEEKIRNAIANYDEAPIQMKAASDAYLQKSVLYKNGLATIVDVTQALYALNRAETDRDISNNNVWQALLLKAAANGDFSLFLNEF